MDPKGIAVISRPVTAGTLAEALDVKVFQVIKDLIKYKIFAKNGDVALDDATAEAVAADLGVLLVIED